MMLANIPTQPDSVMQYVSVCNICGEDHDTSDCSFLFKQHYISDTPIVSRARQTLPKELEIINMADGTTTIITKIELQRGTTFGPLYAKRISTMNPLTNFPIKVFGSILSETYHLDCTNEHTSNWMCFVSPASNAKEQNLICYQVNQNILYTTTRTVCIGEELKVWYAPYYALKMEMPLYDMNYPTVDVSFPQLGHQQIVKIKNNKDEKGLLNKDIAHELADKLPAKHLGAINNKESWNCKICSVEVQSVVSYAKHLMEHYKPLVGVCCDICNKKCNNITVLERHKKAKHSENVSKNNVEKNAATSQQFNSEPVFLHLSDSDNVAPDTLKDLLHKVEKPPLSSDIEINENEKEISSDIALLDSTSINVNDLLQNNGCLNISLELSSVSDSMLSETCVEPVKFSVEELTSDLLDIVSDVNNENIKADKLDCDICTKRFDKVLYLYRHLRKHTGEFTCPSCLNVFARKENLLSHTCFMQKMGNSYECSICQKSFLLKKYFKRHVARHNAMNHCKHCKGSFSSQLEYDTHECGVSNYICIHCKKRFIRRAHLNRHIKLHVITKPTGVEMKKKKKKPEDKPVICEKCGDVFKNRSSLKQHLRSHGERMFECDVCHSRFHRIGVLKEHKTSHESAQVPCNVCGKKMKSKKALDIHMLVHGNKRYHCEKCDKSFFQKCNYLKHYKQIHTEKESHNCPYCPTRFTNQSSFNKHIACHTKPPQFPCTLCSKAFHKEFQLKRHVQSSHSGIIYRCPFCSMTARHKHSMRRHFERQHNDLKDRWNKADFVNQLAEKSDMISVESVSSQLNTEAHPYSPAEGKSQSVKDVDGDEPMKESQIALPDSVSKDPETLNADLTLHEVPQLSINETDNPLAESVLRSTYIFDEGGGDIMFYVLDSTPVSTEY